MPRSAVRWGGAQTAPDGGIDIEVRIEEGEYAGDFVPRAWTGIQVKKLSMSPVAIDKEMAPEGILRPAINDIFCKGGAYLIISLDDDPTASQLEKRRTAMQKRIPHVTGADYPVVDFLGRNELARWLAAHPSVQLWVREQLALPCVGWRPFGRWSAPADTDDTLIIEDGIRILAPSKPSQKLGIVDGINAMRELIRDSPRTIRIVGFSGIGKTRIIQALFEEEVGEEPLDRTKAIYADLGDDLTPTASELFDHLLAKRKDIILVLDNCPSELHSRLAQRIANEIPHVRLITVEYDLRDDQPERTEVVRIAAEGTKAVEMLLKKRFPHVGQVNADRVARFAEGNARIALAIAERLEERENIATFSDETLFNKLFDQRNAPNDDLRQAAEVMSLVYSFSVEANENGQCELDTLGHLINQDRKWLYRKAQELLERQIVQKRGRWRAVLPHAIANRLAAAALNRISREILHEAFEREAISPRLMQSFAHRLGYLHDHEIAVKIVRSWLSEGGILSDIGSLDDSRILMLRHASPADPEATLRAIESCVANEENVARLMGNNRSNVMMIVDILLAIAYDEVFFARCISALVAFARHEHANEKNTSVRECIFSLFSQFLSGTKAKPELRAKILRHYLDDNDSFMMEIGIGMLEAALKTENWISASRFDFGARPRDHGYDPVLYLEQTEWYIMYLDLMLETLSSITAKGRSALGKILADRFRELWTMQELRSSLVQLAEAMNEKRNWIDGWRSVCDTLQYDYYAEKHNQDPEGERSLDRLAELLRPKDIESKIRALILRQDSDMFPFEEKIDYDDQNKWEKIRESNNAKSEQLGQLAARDEAVLKSVLPDMFHYTNSCGHFFGKGLAQGYKDHKELWSRLVAVLSRINAPKSSHHIMTGVFEAVNKQDPDLAQHLLDEAVECPLLRKFFISLQQIVPVNERDVERIKKCLQHDDLRIETFTVLAHHRTFIGLTEDTCVDLLSRVTRKPGGAIVVVKGLALRFIDNPTVSPNLARLGLYAARKVIQEWKLYDHFFEYNLEKVVNVCLKPDEHPKECRDVLQALTKVVKDPLSDNPEGLCGALQMMATRMPYAVLDALFDGSDPQEQYLADIILPDFLRGNQTGHNPLDGITSHDLIAWAKKGNLQGRLEQLAGSVCPFKSTDNGNTVILSDQALSLIEHAKDPAGVMDKLASAVRPTDIMEKRLNALISLKKHKKPCIRSAVEKAITQIGHNIDKRRAWERSDDKNREQTFE